MIGGVLVQHIWSHNRKINRLTNSPVGSVIKSFTCPPTSMQFKDYVAMEMVGLAGVYILHTIKALVWFSLQLYDIALTTKAHIDTICSVTSKRSSVIDTNS